MATVGREFVAEQLWLFVAVVTLPVLVLAAMLGIPFGPEVVTVVGWLLLTPIFLFWGEEIAAVLYGPESDEEGADAARSDPVEELKRRYARGEIEEDEFEARLEKLLAIDAEAERDGTAADAVAKE